MLLALGLVLAAAALVSLLVLRAAVGFLARGADNGWDNAFTYVLLSGLAWAGIVKLALPVGPVAAGAAALAMPFVQLGLLRWIYEIRAGRALVVGVTHAAFTSLIVGGLGLGVGVIAAYVMYGRIVSDPMLLVRILLQLLGLLPPS